MDSAYPRSWSKKRCRPAHLGSCQYPRPQHFRTAITGTTISFVGYAFVDDTDLCITGQNPNDTEADVALRMKQALDLWEGGIRATGGAIVPEKSHWYLIDFKWQQGNWRYVTEIEVPAQLFFRDTFVYHLNALAAEQVFFLIFHRQFGFLFGGVLNIHIFLIQSITFGSLVEATASALISLSATLLSKAGRRNAI
jgi:hypothetical protein